MKGCRPERAKIQHGGPRRATEKEPVNCRAGCAGPEDGEHPTQGPRRKRPSAGSSQTAGEWGNTSRISDGRSGADASSCREPRADKDAPSRRSYRPHDRNQRVTGTVLLSPGRWSADPASWCVKTWTWILPIVRFEAVKAHNRKDELTCRSCSSTHHSSAPQIEHTGSGSFSPTPLLLSFFHLILLLSATPRADRPGACCVRGSFERSVRPSGPTLALVRGGEFIRRR